MDGGSYTRKDTFSFQCQGRGAAGDATLTSTVVVQCNFPDGRIFWRNLSTQAISFTDPALVVAGAPPAAKAAVPVKATPVAEDPPTPSEWLPVSHQGRIYYYNTLSGRSQWEAPAGIDAAVGEKDAPPASVSATANVTPVSANALSDVRIPPQGHGVQDFGNLRITGEQALDQAVRGFHSIVQQRNLLTRHSASYTVAFATPVASVAAWYNILTAMGITLHPADGGAPEVKLAPYGEPNRANGSILSWKVMYVILPKTHLTFEYGIESKIAVVKGGRQIFLQHLEEFIAYYGIISDVTGQQGPSPAMVAVKANSAPPPPKPPSNTMCIRDAFRKQASRL